MLFGKKREKNIYSTCQIHPLKILFRASRFLETLKHAFCIKVFPEIFYFSTCTVSLWDAKNLSCALESSNDSTLLRFLYCRKQIFKRREKRFQIWNKTFETFPIYGCSIIPRMGWKSEVARREKVRNCRIRPRERERETDAIGIDTRWIDSSDYLRLFGDRVCRGRSNKKFQRRSDVVETETDGKVGSKLNSRWWITLDPLNFPPGIINRR